ncbi:hypothetical protein D3C87_1661100 [compost metagenome]
MKKGSTASENRPSTVPDWLYWELAPTVPNWLESPLTAGAPLGASAAGASEGAASGPVPELRGRFCRGLMFTPSMAILCAPFRRLGPQKRD